MIYPLIFDNYISIERLVLFCQYDSWVSCVSFTIHPVQDIRYVLYRIYDSFHVEKPTDVAESKQNKEIKP